MIAAQVDIPSEDDTPREEKDALESTSNHHKGNSEYVKDLLHYYNDTTDQN